MFLLIEADYLVIRCSLHECLMGQLGGISRVLATHQVQFLPYVDRIYVVQDGAISASGTYDEVNTPIIVLTPTILTHSDTVAETRGQH